MTSVERIVEYTNIDGEKLDERQIKPGSDWPTNGEVLFEDVSFAYDENSPIVLKNMTFKIEPNEKVGVVGRTGAGKSTIFQTLLRMAELRSGKVSIDSINIKDISLHDLRSKIAIIPVNTDYVFKIAR
jgi:ABC-type multidrug transport system fused ATPase/permease subunit